MLQQFHLSLISITIVRTPKKRKIFFGVLKTSLIISLSYQLKLSASISLIIILNAILSISLNFPEITSLS